MPLSSGTRLGPYEIQSAIGAGGMGEVYRARDTRLKRDVALKILPDSFASDPERLARFQREAEVLASVNHPNIASIYGVEESGSTRALVMELVEGETLADCIARGTLPLEKTLRIAIQIAEALEAAHEKSIIHRDLKPANVKIAPDGTVKVLDFGLAKALEGTPATANLSHSPTLSMMATQAGTILGTAAYMSPEQAKGFPADQRSDIFSFGCVLFEMLTGRQPFKGDIAAEVLASVLIGAPDFTSLPPHLNPRLPDLLKRCLDKNPKRRWQAIGDVRAELETIAAAPRAASVSSEVIVRRPLWKRSIPVAVAAVVTAAISGFTAWRVWPIPQSLPVTRFQFALAEGQQFTNEGRQLTAISPDGTRMVYVANGGLYLRSMSALEATLISGTASEQGALNPVFSPDGQSIAFWSPPDQTIKRIAINGGAAATICPATRPFGMAWDATGIVFGQGTAGVQRVSAMGGKPELLVKVKDDEFADSPQMLPDGRAVLFTLAKGTDVNRWDKAQIVVQSLTSGERKILIEGGSDGRYVSSGHIVYALGGTLLAVPFDLRRLEVTGGPVPMVEGVKRASTPDSQTGVAHFSVSKTGSLMYIPGPASAAAYQRDLALLERKGVTETLKLPPGPYEFPRISPDGKRVAFGTDDGKEAIIWIYELSGTSSMRRLTFGGKNRAPMWSADGERVAFQSDREGDLAIFWQRADGSGTAERLTRAEPGTAHVPESWAPMGERFLFSATKGNSVALWSFSIKEKKAAPFDGVQMNDTAALPRATFSPDGRWVAYGAGGLYVQPFPPTGAKYQISKVGTAPVWSPDGKELSYFVAGATTLNTPAGREFLVVNVTTRPTLSFSNPVSIPSGSLQFGGGVRLPRPFDLLPDGRIIGVVDSGQTSSAVAVAPQINVVLNWFDELKARAPRTKKS